MRSVWSSGRLGRGHVRLAVFLSTIVLGALPVACGGGGGGRSDGGAGSGGSAGSNGGASGSAGSTGSGGSAGATGTGGTGAGGSTGSGGSAGAGGTTGAGGAAGAGGTTGAGGAAGAGGTTGAGGAAGAGGTTGASGAAGVGGTTGAGGAAGVGGTTGAGRFDRHAGCVDRARGAGRQRRLGEVITDGNGNATLLSAILPPNGVGEGLFLSRALSPASGWQATQPLFTCNGCSIAGSTAAAPIDADMNASGIGALSWQDKTNTNPVVATLAVRRFDGHHWDATNEVVGEGEFVDDPARRGVAAGHGSRDPGASVTLSSCRPPRRPTPGRARPATSRARRTSGLRSTGRATAS